MSQQLIKQLDEIEQRIIKLTEQNAFFRRMCQDLADAKKKLEAENKLLRETVDEQNGMIRDLDAMLESQSQPNPSTTAKPELDRQAILDQIESHIQQLDQTLEWLSAN